MDIKDSKLQTYERFVNVKEKIKNINQLKNLEQKLIALAVIDAIDTALSIDEYCIDEYYIKFTQGLGIVWDNKEYYKKSIKEIATIYYTEDKLLIKMNGYPNDEVIDIEDIGVQNLNIDKIFVKSK